jgi:predicted Rossmann-fold nucleotide-binding protein
MDWVKNTLLEEGNISPEDLDMVHVVDTEDEVLSILNNFYNKNNFSPNF